MLFRSEHIVHRVHIGLVILFHIHSGNHVHQGIDAVSYTHLTTQEVEIYFNFVGRYILPALQPVPLTPEEQEELRKKEERKDRLHQNYLRRKANGKQKEWEERYNARRKAQVEAAKAAIRAEDMEKGIFTTVSQLPRQ